MIVSISVAPENGGEAEWDHSSDGIQARKQGQIRENVCSENEHYEVRNRRENRFVTPSRLRAFPPSPSFPWFATKIKAAIERIEQTYAYTSLWHETGKEASGYDLGSPYFGTTFEHVAICKCLGDRILYLFVRIQCLKWEKNVNLENVPHVNNATEPPCSAFLTLNAPHMQSVDSLQHCVNP